MANLDFPTSPILNQTYSANGKVWTWDGSSWIAKAASIVGTAITTNTTPPSTPTTGDLWWNSELGQLAVYYNDGTSGQWVDAAAGQQGATGYTGSQGIIGYTGSAGPPAVTPTSKTSSFTFSLSEANTTTVVDSSSAVEGLIPTNASVAYPLGTKLRMFRKGIGSVKFVPDTGVTLNLPTGITPKRFMGAIAKKNADQTLANYSTIGDVAWDGTDPYDTDGFHDPSSNNSQHTIPSGLGITKVEVGATIRAESSSGGSDIWMWITKGGTSAYPGMPAQSVEQNAQTGVVMNVYSGDVAAAPGDYFKVGYQNSDTSVTIVANQSSFWIKVTEIDAQGFVTYQYGAVEIEKVGTDEWVVTDHSALG